MSQFNEMIDEEILFYINALTRNQRPSFGNRVGATVGSPEVLSFKNGDITIWIHLGPRYSIPECPDKNLMDYQSFTIQMLDKDEGDSFGSPLGDKPIYPYEDVRFHNQSWSALFNMTHRSRTAEVSVETFCQIIRFVEKVQKLTAFL